MFRCVRCGFRKFIFVNGHAGNTPAVDVVARELIREHDDVKIVMASVWQIADSLSIGLYDVGHTSDW